jgi:hypothetical protein
VLSLESLQIQGNHNWLKSLSFFFGQTLSEEMERRRMRFTRIDWWYERNNWRPTAGHHRQDAPRNTA